MPTRILYWNIENFSIKKIDDPSRKRPRGHGGESRDDAAQRRRALIIRHITTYNPDIIVVVEVCTGARLGAEDIIHDTGGLQVCRSILAYLRTTIPYNGQGWRLVPPLIVGNLGREESVAVFFRGNFGGVTRYFTGPNWYSGGYAGTSQDPGGAIAHAIYPNTPGLINFLAMLRPVGTPGRVIPGGAGGALYNGGISETHLAARIRFLGIPVPPAPPAPVGFGNFRQPYMVTFSEFGGGPNPRHITIIACHAPPNNLPPAFQTTAFMNLLPTMADIANAPAANEVKIICGDFNLPLLLPNGADNNPYHMLTNIGYGRMLQPGPPPVAPPGPAPGLGAAALEVYKGYFCTHIKTKDKTKASRFLWSDGGTPSPYPGYGYLGSTFGANLFSIDNILVRSALGGVPNFTIVNSVVGSPLTAVAMPPGGAPTGVGMPAFLHDMYNLAPWPEQPNAANYIGGMGDNRCSWVNYGHIRNTSDHFALVLDIP